MIIRIVLLAVLTAATAVAQSTVAIHDIQGSGTTSPLAGQTVTTTGVVTGVKSNGFFLQAPDASADANPATSEGIFVFTSSVPSVARGNRVNVTGRVTEYVPSADPRSPSLTEISGSPTVTVLAESVSLPAPVVLTAAQLPASGGPNVLEHLEGMRVHVDQLLAIAPTGGFVEETTAKGTTNGVLWGVIAGVKRPMREPGIDVLDALPSGSPCCVPRFDGNPERLRIESAAQSGAPALEVNTGATLRNVFGILDYAYRTWTIAVDVATTPRVSANYGAAPLAPAAADEISIATMNLQRLYDTRDTRNLDEPIVSAEGYARRIGKIARAIVEFLDAPDIIAVQEAEDLYVLQDIAARVSTLTTGSETYTAALVEGRDPSGIDVGFLVNTRTTQITASVQEAWGATYISPRTGRAETLHDRPPFRIEVEHTAASGKSYDLTLVTVHPRSLSGIATADDGLVVRAKRKAQAEGIATLLTSLQNARPAARIIVLGDFNAFEFSDGWVDLTGVIVGYPADASSVVMPTDPAATVDPELAILTRALPETARYTYVYRGTAQAFDHVLVSRNLMPHFRSYRIGHFNADFPETLRNDAARVERFSDHDVPLLRLALAPPVSRSRPARR
ncbi:MAG: hypothetical protein ACYC7A_20895 [Thermoanaerobaculia bacterium]